MVEYFSGEVDPSFNDNEALKAAVLADFTDIVELLLADTRVNPATIQDESGNFKWSLSHRRSSDAVKLLRQDGRLPARFFERT